MGRSSLVPGEGPGSLRSVRDWARRGFRQLMPEVTEDRLADLIMVLDELVSNAVLRGRGCSLARITVGSDEVTLQITDRRLAAAYVPDAVQRSVSGMRLVEAAAERWGQSTTSAGKTVWAALSRR